MTGKKGPGMLRFLWRDFPPFRYAIYLLAALLTVHIAQNLYTSYYIYEDGRCFWADCKILKGTGGQDVVQIGGE